MGWNMILRLLVIIALTCPISAWATAYTSTQNGDWSNAATWGGAGVPGVGDSLSSAHTITVTGNESIGTSPLNQTTFDMTITGKLVIAENASVTVYGNSYINKGTSKSTAGVGLDMSPGANYIVTNINQPTQGYFIKLGQYNIVYARGASGNRAVIKGQDGQTGHKLKGINDGANSSFDADYLDIKNFTDSFTSYVSDAANAFGTSFKHTRWIGNGITKIIAIQDNIAPVTIEDSYVGQSTAIAANRFQLQGKYGHAANLILNRNVFDDQVTFSPPTMWSVANNYFGGNIGTTVTTPLTKTNETYNSFINNLMRGQKVNTETRTDNSYYLNDINIANGGVVDPQIITGDAYIHDSIIDLCQGDGKGDMVGPTGLADANPFTFSVKRNILLPTMSGGSPGKFVSFWHYVGNITTVVENNTVVTTRWSSLNPETGIIGFGEYVAPCSDDTTCGNRPGMVSSFKNNIAWSPPGYNAEGSGTYPQGGFKAVRWNSTLQDMVYATDADYNWGWNLSTSEVAGYHPYTTPPTFFSTGTPDVHGGNGPPGFIDTTRNFATYDSARLGTVASAWVTSTPYSVGDIVSVSDPSVYGGATVNYRAKVAHTSATGDDTTGKPGLVATTNWRTNWEFASHQKIRDDVTRIIDLISWVRAGFAPTNAALKTSGIGGTYIGAMDVVTLGNSAALMMVQ